MKKIDFNLKQQQIIAKIGTNIANKKFANK